MRQNSRHDLYVILYFRYEFKQWLTIPLPAILSVYSVSPAFRLFILCATMDRPANTEKNIHNNLYSVDKMAVCLIFRSVYDTAMDASHSHIICLWIIASTQLIIYHSGRSWNRMHTSPQLLYICVIEKKFRMILRFCLRHKISCSNKSQPRRFEVSGAFPGKMQ